MLKMFSLAEVFKDWVKFLDDVKLVSMIDKCLLYFYNILLSSKSALTQNMRL